MNDKKLIETIEDLFEAQSVLQQIADALWMYVEEGETISPADLEVYSDGMSYAVRHTPSGNEFLFDSSGITEDNVEEVEFTAWPPETMGLYGNIPVKVTR